jgi:hypothetical protein
MNEEEAIEVQAEPVAPADPGTEARLRDALRAVSTALVDLAAQINKVVQQ